MKLDILFVDDEVNVVHGLKRMLRPLRKEWNFYFAFSGKEALKILEEDHIDVIVSDMIMPEMSGAELLEKVKEKYPSIIRYILSGYSKETFALQSAKTAHQFIAKPIAPDELKEKIVRSHKLYTCLEDERLREVVNGLQTLPSVPETYLKLESELSKKEFSLIEVIKIIKNDIAMSAKILQLVNSAFFTMTSNVSDISTAINLLGANTIKSLVLYVNVFESFDGNKEFKKYLSEIWEHSLTVANVSKKILAIKVSNKEELEECYMAGLLHDLGKIIILNEKSFREKILRLQKEKNISYNEAEKEAMNISHAEIGSYLLNLWGLPEKVVEAVLYHHSINDLNFNDYNISSIVYLANLLVNSPEVETDIPGKFGIEKEVKEITNLFVKNILNKGS